MTNKLLLTIALICRCLGADAQIITTVAGTGVAGTSGLGGPATSAQLKHPGSVTVDTAGVIYIADASFVVKRIDLSGIITVYAGAGYGDSGDGGPASAALFKFPGGLATDSKGNLYIGDIDANRVRKVNSLGIIETIAGNGMPGFTGDGGPATAAQLNLPGGICLDRYGNVYINDQNNYRIRKLDTNGIISTFVGNGTPGFSGDGGPATTASINDANNLMTFDEAGSFYFADASNFRIRKVDTNGVITTFCGTGVSGFGGDGGTATEARISTSNGVCRDEYGNFYIADGLPNHRIRKIAPDGTITTFAGTGVNPYNGDNIPATAANIDMPVDMYYHKNNLYFCDVLAQRLRKISIPPTGITAEPAPETITLNPNPIMVTLYCNCPPAKLVVW